MPGRKSSPVARRSSLRAARSFLQTSRSFHSRRARRKSWLVPAITVGTSRAAIWSTCTSPHSFGLPFDIESLESRGVPAPLLDDVADDAGDRTAHFQRRRKRYPGLLSGKAGTSARAIAWMERSGKTEPLLDTPGRFSHLSPSPDGKHLAFVSGFPEDHIWVLDLLRRRPSRLRSRPRETSGRSGHPTGNTSFSVHRTAVASAARSGGSAPMAPVNRNVCWRATTNCTRPPSPLMAVTWPSTSGPQRRSTTS